MGTVIKCDLVTMPIAEYEKLLADSLFLNCLRNAGVDNWQGYEDAQRAYREDNEDPE